MHQLPKRRPGRMLLGMGAGIFAVSLLGSPALAATNAQAASAATQAGGMALRNVPKKTTPTRATRVIALARDYSGHPHRRGAAGPKSFDGSGFTRFIFGRVGVRLPHNSARQADYGRKVAKRNARPGDLILFTNGATITTSRSTPAAATCTTPPPTAARPASERFVATRTSSVA